MKYLEICKGTFIERPNRFIAKVLIDGREEAAHVKNTGRCRELLIPGAELYLEDFKERMGKRKMRYSLVAVKKGQVWINMDSQAPNHVVKEALQSGRLMLPGMEPLVTVKAEKTYGDSRLDFYVEDASGQKGFMEVKGVTLEEDGIARFPDAPTQRGVKHVQELMKAAEEGYFAYILFVIQMKHIARFMPNDVTHQAFGDALRQAEQNGVQLLAYDCQVNRQGMELSEPVRIEL